jgi:hypothetical protein
MTRALPFTKASIKRRIDAVLEAGLFVTGVTPDGTLIVEAQRPDRKDDADDPLTAVPKLRDAREKFGGSLNGPR